MRTFRVVKQVVTKAEEARGGRFYSVIDNDGNPLTRRNGSAIRQWSTEKAAQRIADLCNEAEQYPHS